MMDAKCEIVWDLLPLYLDGVCHEESHRLVENHLKDCKKCQDYFAKLQSSCDEVFESEKESALSEKEKQEESNIPEKISDWKTEKRELKKGIRRYKKRILVPFVAILLALPILASTVFLSVNEIRKEGICYSNIAKVHNALKFAKELQNKNLDYVVAHLDYKEEYDSVMKTYHGVDLDSMYHEIVIEGETYIVYNDSCFGDLLTNEEYTWEQIIENGVGGVIFPKEEISLLETYSTDDPNMFCKIMIAGQIYYTFSGNYVHGETNQLYVGVSAYLEDDSVGVLPSNVPLFANLFPKKCFLEYQKRVESEWEASKKYLEENYGDVFSSTWEEYSQKRRTQVLAELEDLFAQGYQIERVKFADAYCYWGTQWGIQISFDIKCPQGNNSVIVDFREGEDGYCIASWVGQGWTVSLFDVM